MKTKATSVLLVEDSEGDAGLLRFALRAESSAGHSFSAEHVTRLDDALKTLKKTPFDLILLDLFLPDTQGMETLARMRQAAPDLPIVIMTGLNDESMAVDAVRRGAQDYLVKGQTESRTVIRSLLYSIERKRIEVQLEKQRARQAALQEVNLAITSTLELDAVLDIFLEKVAGLFPGVVISVQLLNDETGVLGPLACRGLEEVAWERTGSPLLSKAVLEKADVIVISDAASDPRTSRDDFMERNCLNAYVGVPLKAKGETLGVIGFYARERQGFTDDDIDLMATLAGQAAVAILNSRVHERLKSANDVLEQTLEIKSVLVGVMAHELKTPIQILLGSAELLAAGLCGELNADQIERVKAIEASGNELLDLIKSALDMARLEHGKMPLVVSEVSVSGLLGEIRSESESAFRERGLDLGIDSPPPGLTIKTDKIKLKEVLRNLLDNARKYTPSGKVAVEFSELRDNKIELRVRDTGVGIRKELLPKIFDLFYQADDTPKDQAAAGLGLSIVKRLVIALAGQIQVSSEVGKGTTFRVILPREIS
jgi:signal transduction histidine kinase/ActR/RegA family two-component response regulator